MIELAHTVGGSSGPEIEFLVLAGAALITAVILFVQKQAPPAVSVVLLLVAIGLGAGAFAIGGGQDAGQTRVAIVNPKPGDEVDAGAPVKLEVAVSDQPAGSHIHVFVDGALEQMPTGLTAAVVLKRGPHELLVELTNVDHSSFDPRVTDSIKITAR